MNAKAQTEQKFVVSHLREEDFKSGGLRTYAKYRDLGLVEATHGEAQAHVIRLVEPCSDEVRKRHFHDVKFQLVYCLQGWMKIDIEGQGVITMKKGSFWNFPPGIKHTVMDYSDDCENLEINLPADFSTVEV